MVKNNVTFFTLTFWAFLEKYEYLGVALSNLNKIIDSDKTDQSNECSSLRFIIKCYFVGYSLCSNFNCNEM